MKAFTGKISKEKLLEHMYKHKEADSFIRGDYNNYNYNYLFGKPVPHKGKPYKLFKGCAVGCAVNSINLELDLGVKAGLQSRYYKHLGIPKRLATIQDDLFEIIAKVSKDDAVDFAIDFFKAINVGADLTGFCVMGYYAALTLNLSALDVVKALLRDLRRVK